MIDSVEAYKVRITNLDKELINALNNGLKFTSPANDFMLKYKQLLLDASNDKNWHQIAENIAFMLYAGTIQNELVQKQAALQNLSINAINVAVNKVDEDKIVINELNEFLTQKAEREKAGGRAKAANDPKQNEKNIVRECWEAWQNKPSQYKNNTKFANAMIDKFRPDNPDDESKHLSSVKVITDWCKDWKAKK
jgi:hypothetical protein